MTRRRPIRRGFHRKPFKRVPIPMRHHPLLIKANRLFSEKKYENAANIFGKLAKVADARGEPRAPQFYLQAGRSNLLADKVDIGYDQVQKGLSQLANEGRWLQLHHLSKRASAELDRLGLKEKAKELTSWIEGVVPDNSDGGYESNGRMDNSEARKPRYVLPISCPSCGGRVHPDEVDWVDDIKAECSFCGNIILAEESQM